MHAVHRPGLLLAAEVVAALGPGDLHGIGDATEGVKHEAESLWIKNKCWRWNDCDWRMKFDGVAVKKNTGHDFFSLNTTTV